MNHETLGQARSIHLSEILGNKFDAIICCTELQFFHSKQYGTVNCKTCGKVLQVAEAEDSSLFGKKEETSSDEEG